MVPDSPSPKDLSPVPSELWSLDSEVGVNRFVCQLGG